MARITLKGTAYSTSGFMPAFGAVAPAFSLVKSDLSTLMLGQFAGKKVILNIFPSVDTAICATSVRTFNKRAAEAPGCAVICVSMDLPFAFARFCAAEGIDRVVCGSAFRSTFGKDYGLTITDGPLQGLLARSIIVIDGKGIVRHTELVAEIANEPNYQAALTSVAAAAAAV